MSSSSLFENITHAAAYAKFRPVPPNFLIEKIINVVRQQFNSQFDYAVDAGCGSGQSAKLLAQYFPKVIGTDISQAQLNEAKKDSPSSIDYVKCSSESIPLPDSSVQLITCSQSIHWFNNKSTMAEFNRILKPKGVLAVFGYYIPLPYFFENESKTMKAKNVIMEFYRQDLGKYWAAERVFVDNYYDDILLEFYEDVERDKTMKYTSSMNLNHYFGYFTSWSAYETLKNKNPEMAKQVFEKLKKNLSLALEAESDTIIPLQTDYFLVMGRKKAV